MDFMLYELLRLNLVICETQEVQQHRSVHCWTVGVKRVNFLNVTGKTRPQNCLLSLFSQRVVT